MCPNIWLKPWQIRRNLPGRPRMEAARHRARPQNMINYGSSVDHLWIISGSFMDHFWCMTSTGTKVAPRCNWPLCGPRSSCWMVWRRGRPGPEAWSNRLLSIQPTAVAYFRDLWFKHPSSWQNLWNDFLSTFKFESWLVAMHAFFILSTHFLGLHFDKFSRPASAWDQPVQVTGDVLRTSRSVAKDLCHSTVEAGPGATCVTQRDFPENLDGRHWAGSLLLSWVWSFRIFERPDTAESFLRNLLLSNLISPGLSIRCTWIRKHIPFSGMVFAIFRYSPINLNGANGVSFHYYINGYHHKTKSGVLGTTSKLRNWMRFFYELVSHIYCHSNFSTLW